MMKTLSVLVLALMLGACGKQADQQAAAPAAEPAAPAAAAATPAEAAPAAEPVAAAPAAPAPTPDMAAPVSTDEEVKYDPIDTAKLENNWYKQYSAGQ